jgi:hypothetical protein
LPELVEKVYRRASELTGMSQQRLESLALHSFASILHHALKRRGEVVWTVCSFDRPGDHPGGIFLEVDVPRRPLHEPKSPPRSRRVIIPTRSKRKGH